MTNSVRALNGFITINANEARILRAYIIHNRCSIAIAAIGMEAFNDDTDKRHQHEVLIRPTPDKESLELYDKIFDDLPGLLIEAKLTI